MPKDDLQRQTLASAIAVGLGFVWVVAAAALAAAPALMWPGVGVLVGGAVWALVTRVRVVMRR